MNAIINIITTMNKHIDNLLNNKNIYYDDNDDNNINDNMNNIIPKKNIKNMRIYFADYKGIHHKNRQFIEYFISKYPHIVNDINKADVIISGYTFYDPSKYKDKLFIFGPHFCIFPDDKVNFDNKYSNAYYNNLSEWCKNTWSFFNYDKVPLLTMPYGVDTELFKPDKERKDRDYVLLYYKNRHPLEIVYMIHFLVTRNIKVKLFDYKSGYSQEEYIECLKNAKYGIWVGSHESQGFALQECLSYDVPLLVWDVIRMLQEYGNEEIYQNIMVNATTIPYWSDNCGEYFISPYELENTYDKFINNLDNYKPREYILNTLSREKCYKNWINNMKDLYQKI